MSQLADKQEPVLPSQCLRCGGPGGPHECLRRVPHPVPRYERRGSMCEEYEEYGCAITTCPETCWLALPD